MTDFSDMYAQSGQPSNFAEINPPASSANTGSGLDPNIARLSKVKAPPQTLKIIGKSPAVMYVVDANTNAIQYITNKFYLTGSQELREEKAQIMETFGSAVSFFFGQKQTIYSFSGMLLEAGSPLANYEHKYLWTSSFLSLYDNHLRASKLAEQKNKAVLVFENNILYGYPINMNIQRNSNSPAANQFSFAMLVTHHRMLEASSIKDLYAMPTTTNIKELLATLSDLDAKLDDAKKELKKMLKENKKSMRKTQTVTHDQIVIGKKQEEINTFESEIADLNKKIAQEREGMRKFTQLDG